MEKIRAEGREATDERRGGRGILSGIGSAIKKSFTQREGGAMAPLYDSAVFVIAFLLARCHLIFGAYPRAIAVIAI